MRPRSASEWRDFWRDGGERQLELVLREVWPPLRGVSEEVCTAQAERVALLLSSAAPARALVGELGRIRGQLAVDADPAVDEAAAARVRDWFQAQTIA